MQKYKLAIVVIVVFVAFIVAGYFMVQTNQQKSISKAIDAVPIDVAFILETNDLQNLIEETKQNAIWQELIKIDNFAQLDSQITYTNSLLKGNFSILRNKNILISAHKQGKNKVEFLYLISLPRSADQKRFLKKISEHLQGKAEISERSHDGTKIFDVVFSKPEKNFSFSISEGILSMSYSQILLENSVRQIKSENSIGIDSNFKKISKTAGKNATANIYVNYEFIGKTLSHMFATQTAKDVKSVSKFSNWSALDVVFESNTLTFAGFSFAGNDNKKFINLFKNQKPKKIEIGKILPAETSQFVYFAFSDSHQLKLALTEYQKGHDLQFKLQKQNDEYKKKYETNLQSTIWEVTGTQIAVAQADFNNYIVLETNSKNSAEKKLQAITQAYCEKNNLKPEDYHAKYKINDENIYDVYKMPFENLLNYAFENIYEIPKHKYYAFLDNYIVFTDSYDNLKKLIKNFNTGNVLQSQTDYQKIMEQTGWKANIFVYKGLNKNTGKNIQMLNGELADWYKHNSKILNKFQDLSVQISAEPPFFYTQIVANYNPQAQAKSSAVWQAKLDGKIITKPLLFTNHYTFKKEIALQDDQNNLYLIDNNGKAIFKNQLTEKILGEIHQIDYYNNFKYQLLFNTENYIYIVDRNGNNVEGFPVKLESPATNPMAVFDYDGDKNYRFFVASKNKKIYLYGKDGKIIDGWKQPETATEVEKQIQFFSYKGKDYIVACCKIKVYIYDRQGNPRITPDADIAIARNSKIEFQSAVGNYKSAFVGTLNSGEIIRIDLEGKTQTLENKKMADSHFFELADINGDGIKDYIFAEKNHLEVFDYKLDKILSYDAQNQITESPIVFRFSADDIKIGVVSGLENKIYLINNNGKSAKGFPKKGNTLYSIGILGTQNIFNVVVGSKDNSVYNYQLD